MAQLGEPIAKNPTLEALEEQAQKTAHRAHSLRESLEMLLADLGHGAGQDTASKAERPMPGAIISRISEVQRDGIGEITTCEDLVHELRRALFSTPIEKPAPQVARRELGIGARAA